VQQRELPRPVIGQQRPRVERDPVCGVADEHPRDPAWIHVGVRFTHDLL